MDNDRSTVGADAEATRAHRGGRPAVARVVSVVAATTYVVVLAVGLYPADASYRMRWQPVSCPTLAGPTGTSTDLQQLWVGSRFCPTTEWQRVVVLAGLAALAAIVGASVVLRRRWSVGIEMRDGRRDVAGVACVVALAMVLPMWSLVIWRSHDVASIGPREVSGSVAAERLCLGFAGGLWHGSGQGMDPDGDHLVTGTIILSSRDVATFTSDIDPAFTTQLRASWPDPRGAAVGCAIA